MSVLDFFTISLMAIPLIAVIAAVRYFAVYRLPKRIFYIFWIIVLLRLVLPFNFFSQFSIYNVIDFNMYTSSAVTIVKQVFDKSLDRETFEESHVYDIKSVESKANISNTHTSIKIKRIIFCTWLVGFFVFALYFFISDIRFRKKYSDSIPVENSFIRIWRVEYSDFVRRKIKVRQSELIVSPLTYGIFTPVILLPKNMDYSDEATLEYVLLHEYTHIKRFDTALKLILTAVLCLHWFNPFVWLMYVLANRDIELSCDEIVVNKKKMTDKNIYINVKSDYALTLITMEEKKSIVNRLCSHFSRNIMSERIESIMKIERISKPKTLVVIILICIITILFATSPASAVSDTAVNNDILPQDRLLLKSSKEMEIILPHKLSGKLVEGEDDQVAYSSKSDYVFFDSFAVKGENIASVTYESKYGTFGILLPFYIDGIFSGGNVFLSESPLTTSDDTCYFQIKLLPIKATEILTDTFTITVTFSNGEIITQVAEVSLDTGSGEISSRIVS